ncbi:hypothetical protein [Nocardia brevicatena]|uniref:hypothetical protein n=1 Tax=Nocardia brevicatena TaxID=37327 RepID=UPI000310266B|nr:hypothetical protein [Nocardia brevicatena]
MILRKLAGPALAVAAALMATAGISHAQPAPAPDVRYEAALVGDRIVTTLTDGTFQVAGDTVHINDSAGHTLVSLPLTFRENGLEFPIPHTVRDSGRVLELTAVRDHTKAHPAPAAPVASPLENQRAQNDFLSQFGLATAVGGFIGLALGGVIGLLVGAAAGGVGALPGVVLGASIGSIIGTIVAGGPTLVVAGIELINTLNAPPGTTKWASTDAN